MRRNRLLLLLFGVAMAFDGVRSGQNLSVTTAGNQTNRQFATRSLQADLAFTMPTHPPQADLAFTMPTHPPQADLAFTMPTHPPQQLA
jgi:hypothetical protein